MKKIMVFILAFFMLSMNFCTGFIYAKSSNPKILKQLPKEPDIINSEPDTTEKEPVEQIGNENIFIKKLTDNKVSLIDKDGNLILPSEYTVYRKNLPSVFYNENEVVIYDSETGITKLPYNFCDKNAFTYLTLEKDNKYGLYDYKKKEFVLPIEYDDINYIGSGYLIFEKDSKKGIFSDDSGIVIEPLYKDIKDIQLHYGKFFILTNTQDKQSLTLFKNSKQIELISDAEEISDKINDSYYVIVKQNEKWGVEFYNDKDDTLSNVIPYLYDEIVNSVRYYSPKENHPRFFIAKKNEKYGLVRSGTGEEVSDFVYDSIQDLNYGAVLKVEQNGKFGTYNLKNNKVGKIKWDDIKEERFKGFFIPDSHLIKVQKNRRWRNQNKAKHAGLVLGETGYYVLSVAMLPVSIPITAFLFWLFSSNYP